MTPKAALRLSSSLTDWFKDIARPLPWRVSYDPYGVWVSEIMCQQTRIETVLPYYRRWMERLPGVIEAALALQALAAGMIPPTVGLLEAEPGSGLVSGRQAHSFSHPSILSCNSGFGGINAAVRLVGGTS